MRAFLAAAVFLGGFGLAALADDKKPDDKKPDTKKPDDKKKDAGNKPSEQDWRIAYATHSTVQYGCKLWDEQNYEGCYRLYQGFLVGIIESLGHRPKLVARVQEHLTAAAKLDSINGAVELRKALDAVQLETSGKAVAEKKPLWERVGGEKVVRAVVKDTLADIRKDKDLDLTRGGKIAPLPDEDFAAIEQGLVELLSENADGPLKYAGPRLGMVVIGTKITDREFNAINLHFFKALAKHDVPRVEAEELLKILANYKPTVVGK